MPLSFNQQRELDKIGRDAAADLSVYLRFVLGITAAKHQKEWLQVCQNIGDNPRGAQQEILVAPPESGKSTFAAIGFLSWMVGKYPNDHFGLISYANMVAWDRADAIRRLIEQSVEYHFTFPNIEPDKTLWGRAAFRVKRPSLGDPHPTVKGAGANSAVVGHRLDGLLYDDPHKDEGNSRARNKVFTTYQNVIFPRLFETAWQLAISTRWAGDDFVGRLLQEEGWSVHHVAAVVDEKSYWPSRRSMGSLAKIAREKPRVYHVQYQGDTTAGEAGIIRNLITHDKEITPCPAPLYNDKEDFNVHECKVTIGDEELKLLVAEGWDTSFKQGQDNDWCVGYVAGLDADGTIWVLDRVKDRWGTPELAAEMIRLWEKWHAFAVWVEDSAQGNPAVQTLLVELPRVPATTVPPTQGGKLARANSLTPYIHSGRVQFPRMAGWFPDCEYELTHVGMTEHDDDLDALFIVVNKLLDVVHPDAFRAEQRPRAHLSMK